jgi:hypothetical protein
MSAELSPSELLTATAADMRAVADAASPAPWSYDSYARVGSTPLYADYDGWVDPLLAAGHNLERYTACGACGQWQFEIPPLGVVPGRGCRHFGELYRDHDPTVAYVPPEAGDTATGRHQHDATHIAAWGPGTARIVADWLDVEATELDDISRGPHGPAGARFAAGPEGGPMSPALLLCRAWWAGRGREPKGPDRG